MRSICAAALALGVAAPAWAELKIGFVNADRVMRDSAPAVRAQKKLEKEFERREQELQRTSKQLQSMQDELEKNAVTLSEQERRQKERDFAEINRDYQRARREYLEDRNRRLNEELSGVLERANKAIRQVAESEKYDLILQEAVYFSPRIDITDKVIRALTEAPPSK